MLADEIQSFRRNLDSCQTNLKNGHINNFVLKAKNTDTGQCVFLPNKAIREKEFYKSHLGTMQGMENIDIDEVVCDCRLIYNKLHKSYILLVPYYEEIIIINDRQKIVALDPAKSQRDFSLRSVRYTHIYLLNLLCFIKHTLL